jgi:UDP:flavonoid glycosyltransferase YjiC (YdhE family)
MNEKRTVSVLVAPLDWGLGHATRCIPIINALIQQGAQVILAASGSVRALLSEEFPLLEFVEIPGYDIEFKRGIAPKWSLVLNIRRVLKKIREENIWLETFLEKRKIDAVISDNRFGLFNKKSYCVFITHQLLIKSGWPSSIGRWSLAVSGWIDYKILKWNYRFIEKFSTCWIPDWEGEDSIAGQLSHPRVLPEMPVKYIGVLSRFKKSNENAVRGSVLILLSGPEPQRTQFENLLFKQIVNSPLEFVVVRGLPGKKFFTPLIKEGVKIYNHLSAYDLNKLMNESEIVISRSGYSTIMDLITLGKTAILVPTSGQTEQEYLAKHLQERNWMYCAPQKNFKLDAALDAFRSMEKKMPAFRDSELHDLVKELLIKIAVES